MHIFTAPSSNPAAPYPTGPMSSSVYAAPNRPGVNSTMDGRQSLIPSGFVNAPPYEPTYTRRITPDFPGTDGFQELKPTYQAYDKVIAVYTQPGQASAAPWQEDQYPVEHRPLVERLPLGYGQALLYYEIEASRPPVNGIDYYLGQITTDQSMGR